MSVWCSTDEVVLRKTFEWQEKVFSVREVLQYAHSNNKSKTPLDRCVSYHLPHLCWSVSGFFLCFALMFVSPAQLRCASGLCDSHLLLSCFMCSQYSRDITSLMKTLYPSRDREVGVPFLQIVCWAHVIASVEMQAVQRIDSYMMCGDF